MAKDPRHQAAGRACAEKFGREHMAEIGARGGRAGGKALVESRGTDYMREIGARGPAKRTYRAGWQHSEVTREKMRQAQQRRRRSEKDS